MQNVILRSVDFLDKSDWIYGAIPKRLSYLRDIPDESGGLDSSPYARIKALHEYMPLVFTDMYRSAKSSAIAYETKTGVQKPGYSGHNFGVSIDLAIDRTLKRHGITYDKLVNTCIAFGVTPYQGINNTGKYQREKEDWHFNMIGDCAYHPYLHANETTKPGGAQAIEFINRNIIFNTDATSINQMLEKLKFNSLNSFKKSLSPKLQTKVTNDILVRILNIYTCTVLDEKNNIILN